MYALFLACSTAAQPEGCLNMFVPNQRHGAAVFQHSTILLGMADSVCRVVMVW
jgi:hypothetical protein